MPYACLSTLNLTPSLSHLVTSSSTVTYLKALFKEETGTRVSLDPLTQCLTDNR